MIRFCTLSVLTIGLFWRVFGYGLIHAQTKSIYTPRSHDHIFRKIQKNQMMVVAVSNEYPSLGFQGKGAEVDMAKSLADFLGVKAKIVSYALGDAIEAVEKNKVDIAISGLSRSLARARRVWFSMSYLQVRPAALVDKRLLPKSQFGDTFEDESVKNLSDLNKLTGIILIVHRNSIYENMFPKLESIKHKNIRQGFEMLVSNQGNAILHDSLYLRYQLKHDSRLRFKYSLVVEEKYKEELCIALPFGDVILEESGGHMDIGNETERLIPNLGQ